MGASASRIWGDLCAIESDDMRARTVETLLMSPELVQAARYAGYYADTVAWLAAYRRGQAYRFPWSTAAPPVRDTIQHDGARWSMYTTPVPGSVAPAPAAATAARRTASTSQEIVVSPAAKAMDYFQECLALLGISETEQLTHDRIRSAFKRASLTAHPDKGGTPEAFAELKAATNYVTRILDRVAPRRTADEEARLTQAVSMETAERHRQTSAPRVEDRPPVALSAKKLDMGMFNRLFEENRLPDPTHDGGYGDWLKSQEGSDEVARDKKVTPQNFESVFRDKALRQAPSTAITRRLEPEALVSPQGYELGGDVKNFTAAFGSDTQFTDLKDAYTTGATMYHEVADVKVRERSARSVAEAERIRAEEMSRVDPDEKSRIAAAAAALEERERQRRLRLAQQDTAAEGWHDSLRRRLLVNS